MKYINSRKIKTLRKMGSLQDPHVDIFRFSPFFIFLPSSGFFGGSPCTDALGRFLLDKQLLQSVKNNTEGENKK